MALIKAGLVGSAVVVEDFGNCDKLNFSVVCSDGRMFVDVGTCAIIVGGVIDVEADEKTDAFVDISAFDEIFAPFAAGGWVIRVVVVKWIRTRFKGEKFADDALFVGPATEAADWKAVWVHRIRDDAATVERKF